MEEFTVRTTEQLPQPSQLLKAFRKAAQLTQGDVAIRLGVTQQTVSALERNAETGSTARLMKLMNILGVEWVLRAIPRPASGNPSDPAARGSDDSPDW